MLYDFGAVIAMLNLFSYRDLSVHEHGEEPVSQLCKSVALQVKHPDTFTKWAHYAFELFDKPIWWQYD